MYIYTKNFTHLFLVLCFSWVGYAQQDRQGLTARAYALPDSQFVFTEYRIRYTPPNKPAVTHVRYVDPTGSLLAEKKLTYNKQRYTPQINFSQQVDGYRLSAHREGNQVTAQLTEKGKTKTKVFSVPSNAVLDEGIRHLVIDSLEVLRKGNEVSFPLIVPERFAWYTFSFKKLGSPKPGILRLQMGVANPVLALLLKPSIIDYNSATGELIEYRGISDLKDKESENFILHMYFSPQKIAENSLKETSKRASQETS